MRSGTPMRQTYNSVIPLITMSEPLPKKRRVICSGCDRPASVCMCSSFPPQRLPLPEGIDSVVVLMHPSEKKRKNRTVDLVATKCLEGVHVVVGRRLIGENMPADSPLKVVLDKPDECALIYPTDDAEQVDCTYQGEGKIRHLIFVDATWKYAKEMYKSSPPLVGLKHKWVLKPKNEGAFVIRKEPLANAGLLSTAEAIAFALDAVSTDCSRLGAVRKVLTKFSETQLSHTEHVVHRREKKNYVENLYDVGRDEND
ncbi:DTW domain-containing protein 2 [Perkinsus chesapeaki]|uniref:tRNA-uridine aminocarboxypropyltransferase n=1 Tax=Perkinsus chesapeaki TaxID=330153 RepID=A0A7J6M8N0_PERCH|nr:DTW domain-containing protein 2 [Perkinsus chesapeaki]